MICPFARTAVLCALLPLLLAAAAAEAQTPPGGLRAAGGSSVLVPPRHVPPTHTPYAHTQPAPLATGATPQYQVLHAPAPAHHGRGHGYYPGMEQPTARHAYAYGWFGARPARHWSRHFGYYRDYTQWSVR